MSIPALLILTGCAADLTVRNTQVVWNSDMKFAATTIANVGTRRSDATAVYFDGDENPVSQNYRPQVQAEVGPLEPGQSVTRVANLAPLARAENSFLANVFAITVRADPKNLIREGDEGNNTEQRPVAGSAYTCIDFNSIPTGTRYGTPAGQAPGTVVISQGGARVTVENFSFIGGGGTFMFARVDAATPNFGSGNVLHVNNINLDFDFTDVTPPVKQVVLKYADVGGFENLAVNGSPSPIYAGELVAAPSPMGGAIVASTSAAIPGGKRGAFAAIDLAGTIGHLRVGGQEFFLDDVCFR